MRRPNHRRALVNGSPASRRHLQRVIVKRLSCIETSKSCWRSHPTFRRSSMLVLGGLAEMEVAMNMSTDSGQCTRRGGLNQVLTDWWQQQRSRHELESLGDTMLRDIGL